MSSVQIQQIRQAQAIDDAVEAIRESKPDTQRLEEALAEPFLPDEAKLSAIVCGLSEMAARQERALSHMSTHVLASQDKEIAMLKDRVAKAERSLEEADRLEPRGASRAKKKS